MVAGEGDSGVPPSKIDIRGGTRVHKGVVISTPSRTGEEIERDFEEEHGDSLDNPAYLRRRRSERVKSNQPNSQD
jgi:hypothetical protein